MFGQKRFDLIEQIRAGEQIKEAVGIALVGTAANSVLLLRTQAGIRMHSGLAPLGDWMVVRRLHLITGRQPFLHHIKGLGLK